MHSLFLWTTAATNINIRMRGSSMTWENEAFSLSELVSEITAPAGLVWAFAFPFLSLKRSRVTVLVS